MVGKIHPFKFSKKTFSHHDLYTLLHNIFSWRKPHDDCIVCHYYRDWCIELAKERWIPFYVNFDKFINELTCEGGRYDCFFNKVCTADFPKIYSLIERKWYDDGDGWDD